MQPTIMQPTSWRSGIRRDFTRRPGLTINWRSDDGAATAEYAITIMAAYRQGVHTLLEPHAGRITR